MMRKKKLEKTKKKLLKKSSPLIGRKKNMLAKKNKEKLSKNKVGKKKVILKKRLKKISKNLLKKKVVFKRKNEKKPISRKTAGRFTIKVKPKNKLKAERESKKENKKGVKYKKEDAELKVRNTIEDLVYRSKQRGFITEDEILHAFPDVERDIEKLEELYDNLEKNSIKVIGSDEMIKFETDRISEDFEKEKQNKKNKTTQKDILMTNISSDVSSDLVQMYLREIGRVGLLSTAEEVVLAKRIEKND